MIMTGNLHLTGQKVVSAELLGGVNIFTQEGCLQLTADETNALRDFLNEKHEKENADV